MDGKQEPKVFKLTKKVKSANDALERGIYSL